MIFTKAESAQLLSQLLKKLSQLDLYPVIGAEVEFYLQPQYIDKLKNFSQLDIIPEKGLNQFEVRIKHNQDIITVLTEIDNIKSLLKRELNANFSAKPFAQLPSSAFHIHLHLENSSGENLFCKIAGVESDYMLYALGGLCDAMLTCMLLFAPSPSCYQRYQSYSLESPSKVCWGGNNRSAAIRLPLAENFARRLEHRVGSSNSNPHTVMIGILVGILYGLNHKIIPSEKLHGNAYLEQYEYPILTDNYEQALRDFKERFEELLGKVGIRRHPEHSLTAHRLE